MRYVSSVLAALIFSSFLLATPAFGIPQPSPAVLNISNGPIYDFGTITEDGVKHFTFTISNTGGSAAKLMVAINPSGPFLFRGGSYPGRGGNCGKTLNGGGKQCKVVLSFQPVTGGSFSSSFGIQYHDRYATRTVTRAIQGTALTGAILTFTNGSSYNFGSVTNGTTRVRSFTVENSGQSMATQMTTGALGRGYSFEGGYPGAGGNCGTTLAAGSSCILRVSYTPTRRATDEGQIKLNYHNGGALTSVTITLSGRGSGTSAAITSVTPDHGPVTGGTPITIQGSGFRSSFTVRIGTALCTSAVRVSSSRITCVTPANLAGTYDVVYNDGGTDTFNNGFVYDAVPVATSLDITTGPNTGGTRITLTGRDFQSGATVSLGGSSCTNVNFVSETTLECTTSAHVSETVSLTVTNPDNQASTLPNAYTYLATWTWKSGSASADQTTSGTSPGGRDSAASWTDSSSHFWLFGGWGKDVANGTGLLNDLWKFDGSQWTKFSGGTLINQAGNYGTKGVASPTNHPGSRMNAATWIDSSNQLWLLGGFGYDANRALGNLNDLWKFDGTNWTWVSGSSVRNQRGVYGPLGMVDLNNVPGSRVLAAHWVDSSNNLWLFGGWGMDSAGLTGELNDMWVFDGADWTWMGGSNLRNPGGSFGTMGVTSPTNIPSGRDSVVAWKDSSGNFFMFGGWGKDVSNATGYLNDIWKFDGMSWTWIGGSNVANNLSNYGTKDMASVTNLPGGRMSGIVWVDTSNTVWLFGGYGLDASGFEGGLNDLWKFDGTQWTWISGSQVSDVPGIYGTQGMGDLLTSPGTRQYSSGWMDGSNRLWLFGGYGLDGVGVEGELNDLWIYER